MAVSTSCVRRTLGVALLAVIAATLLWSTRGALDNSLLEDFNNAAPPPPPLLLPAFPSLSLLPNRDQEEQQQREEEGDGSGAAVPVLVVQHARCLVAAAAHQAQVVVLQIGVRAVAGNQSARWWCASLCAATGVCFAAAVEGGRCAVLVAHPLRGGGTAPLPTQGVLLALEACGAARLYPSRDATTAEPDLALFTRLGGVRPPPSVGSAYGGSVVSLLTAVPADSESLRLHCMRLCLALRSVKGGSGARGVARCEGVVLRSAHPHCEVVSSIFSHLHVDPTSAEHVYAAPGILTPTATPPTTAAASTAAGPQLEVIMLTARSHLQTRVRSALETWLLRPASVSRIVGVLEDDAESRAGAASLQAQYGKMASSPNTSDAAAASHHPPLSFMFLREPRSERVRMRNGAWKNLRVIVELSRALHRSSSSEGSKEGTGSDAVRVRASKRWFLLTDDDTFVLLRNLAVDLSMAPAACGGDGGGGEEVVEEEKETAVGLGGGRGTAGCQRGVAFPALGGVMYIQGGGGVLINGLAVQQFSVVMHECMRRCVAAWPYGDMRLGCCAALANVSTVNREGHSMRNVRETVAGGWRRHRRSWFPVSFHRFRGGPSPHSAAQRLKRLAEAALVATADAFMADPLCAAGDAGSAIHLRIVRRISALLNTSLPEASPASACVEGPPVVGIGTFHALWCASITRATQTHARNATSSTIDRGAAVAALRAVPLTWDIVCAFLDAQWLTDV